MKKKYFSNRRNCTIKTLTRLGYFPNSWKHAQVLLFHKPGKKAKDITAYRPISLLPSFSKIFEKVTYKRLQKHVYENHIVPPFQFGFRSKYSTTHQLNRITQYVKNGFENKLYTASVFLDVKQAFDKVWLQGLLFKLMEIQVPAYLLYIISSYLTNRSFSTRINASTSTRRNIKAGLPQGSVLGPLLFNIYMYDIPIPEESIIALFADDTAIMTQSSNLNTAINMLQKNINIMECRFSKWRLQLNPLKSNAKIFTLRRINNPSSIKIGETNIQWKGNDQPVKYLGIHLDIRLTWGYIISIVN